MATPPATASLPHRLGWKVALWERCYRRLRERAFAWQMHRVVAVEQPDARTTHVIVHGFWRLTRHAGSSALTLSLRSMTSGRWQKVPRSVFFKDFSVPLLSLHGESDRRWSSNRHTAVQALLAGDADGRRLLAAHPNSSLAARRGVFNRLLEKALTPRGRGKPITLQRAGWGLRKAVWEHLVDKTTFGWACRIHLRDSVDLERYCLVLAHRDEVAHWVETEPRCVCLLSKIPPDFWASHNLFSPARWVCGSTVPGLSTGGWGTRSAARLWLSASPLIKLWAAALPPDIQTAWARWGGLALPATVQRACFGALSYLYHQTTGGWFPAMGLSPHLLGRAVRALVAGWTRWLASPRQWALGPARRQNDARDWSVQVVEAVRQHRHRRPFDPLADLGASHPWSVQALADTLAQSLTVSPSVAVRPRSRL